MHPFYAAVRLVIWSQLANITKHTNARVTFGYGLEPMAEQPRPRCYSINFQLVASAF